MKKIDIKKNVYKRMLALLLTGTIAMTGTGCGKNKDKDKNNVPLFYNTLLEDTVIVDTDLGLVVAKRVEPWGHPHYIDIATGNIIESASLKFRCTGNYIMSEKLEEKCFVTEYLTEDELLLAQQKLLTEENIVNIIYRIINSEKTTDTKKLVK